MAPLMGRQVRWRVAAAVAWVVGAVAGVAPPAFLGDPTPGLGGAALLGVTAIALLAPLLVAPVVALCVCDDDAAGAAPYWHAIGVAVPSRLAARAVVAARLSLRLFPVAVVGALTSALGSAVAGGGGLVAGGRSAPSLQAVALGVGTWIGAVAVGALVGTAAAAPARAVLWLAGAVAVTGLTASLVYFVPAVRVVFWATPGGALWPFDPQSFDSAQFAIAVPGVVRAVSGTTWLAGLGALAWHRRRRHPYPVDGEAGRRARPPRR
jgi:hypothetical protein